MEQDVKQAIVQSAKVNVPLLLVATVVAFLFALRAQNFSDLVFVMLMMYIGAGLLFGNLVIGLMQLVRRKQVTPHVIVGFASAVAAGVLLGIGLVILRF